ncbi:ABC transporter [alpha proteobacterium AAP81b]|nr:ABC transporter [alpha proteobacterium AAP81b]
MASGLFALLDDVAAIAKVAAASLDDTAAAAAKASAKAAGVVIDDAAVTPRYLTGFAPARELPIVGKIALGSLRNKLIILLPAALLLSWLAPWAITPLLMAGGAFLCFEAAEKLWELVAPHAGGDDDAVGGTPEEIEKQMVGGAIRTDLILSGEIMAISLASVAEVPMVEQAVVLVIVGLGITAMVYGAVALIVKADDVGLRLATSGMGVVRVVGRALVAGMPPFLKFLAGLGTAAMLWVGGGIVVHGLEEYGVAEPGHSLHEWSHAAAAALPAAAGFIEWLVYAAGSGLVGLALGAAIVAVLHLVPRGKH